MTFYAPNEPQKLILGRESHFLGAFDDGREMLVSDNDPYRFAVIDRITGFPRNLKTIFECEDKSRNPSGFQFDEFRAISGSSGYLIGSEMNRTCRRTNAHCHDAVLIWAEIDVQLRTIHLRELVDVAEMEGLKQFYILTTQGKASLLSCSTAWSIHGTGGLIKSEVIKFMEDPVDVEVIADDDETEDGESVENGEEVDQEEQAERAENVRRHWRPLEPTVLEEGDQAFLAVIGADEAEVEPDVLQVLVVKKDGTKTCGVIRIPEELHGMFMTVVDGIHRNNVFVCVEHYTPTYSRTATYAIDLKTFAWRLAVPDFHSTTAPLLQFGELHFRIGLSEVWSYKLNSSPQSLRLIAASACNVATWSAWEHKLFKARGDVIKADQKFRIRKKKELVSRQRALHKRLWYPKDIKKHIRNHKEKMALYNKMMADYLNQPRLEIASVEEENKKTNSN